MLFIDYCLEKDGTKSTAHTTFIYKNMQNRQEQLHNELIVIKCQQGNSKAFSDLVGRWQERLWRYAFKVTGSEEAAWDIVQETWCSVIKGLGKLKDVSIFPCWLFRIANNKCVDWLLAVWLCFADAGRN